MYTNTQLLTSLSAYMSEAFPESPHKRGPVMRGSLHIGVFPEDHMITILDTGKAEKIKQFGKLKLILFNNLMTFLINFLYKT